jgi:hypothetical protein
MSQHDDLEEVRELYKRYALSWDDNHPEELARPASRPTVFSKVIADALWEAGRLSRIWSTTISRC